MRFYWLKNPRSGGDTAAFRYTFALERAQEVIIKHFGASWYALRLDGEYSDDGPYRFAPDYPQYSTVTAHLSAGTHVLTAEVRDDCADTRILKKMPPFFGAEISAGKEIMPKIKAARLDGVVLLRRINPQLGWSEDRNLETIPDFENPAFCDDGWEEPAEVFPCAELLEKIDMPKMRRDLIEHKLMAQGKLRCNFGYDNDDPDRKSVV